MDDTAGEWSVAPSRRVFVNRNLRMSGVRVIGFDMDYTLAVYDKYHVENLAFHATLGKLVTDRNYPREVRSLQYDPDLVIRGLVIDKRLGNLLKVDQYNYVTLAYHGKAVLPSEKRKRQYRNSRIRLASDRYMSIDTLFELPEATLFCLLVDYFENKLETPWRDYSRIYEDVRECIDRAHADNTIKQEIMRNPSGFILKDPRLPMLLAAFRAQGKKLFLLTNSEPHYTEVVMQYLMEGAHEEYAVWNDYFDHVVVSASKPDFYQKERALVELTSKEIAAAGIRPGYRVHSGGCSRVLEELCGHRGDEILYVGDHTFGDIMRAKKRPGWRTAMVIQELEDEIRLEQDLASQYRAIERMVSRKSAGMLEANRLRRRLTELEDRGGTRGGTAEEARTLATRLADLENTMLQLGQQVQERQKLLEHRFNKHWGKLFKCGEINSRFGNQVKDFACLYTSAAVNFLTYPESMYFRSPREIMPHEMGIDTG